MFGRKELAKLLNLNKKMEKKLNFLIDYSIRNYNKKDGSEDIEQNIFEGIINYIYCNKVERRDFDLLTKRILNKKTRYSISNKKLIRTIVSYFNILKINNCSHELKFLIMNINSCKYGLMSTKQRDILKMSIEFKEFYVEDYIEDEDYNLEIYDTDSEVETEMKYFVNKYYQSLNMEEQLIFTKYFYEDISFEEMIKNCFVKNEYTLKKFIKKTRNYFQEQLV